MITRMSLMLKNMIWLSFMLRAYATCLICCFSLSLSLSLSLYSYIIRILDWGNQRAAGLLHGGTSFLVFMFLHFFQFKRSFFQRPKAFYGSSAKNGCGRGGSRGRGHMALPYGFAIWLCHTVLPYGFPISKILVEDWKSEIFQQKMRSFSVTWHRTSNPWWLVENFYMT